jgi:hypothetical protein
MVARLYPGTIDGLIYAASMVLLDAARRGVPAPTLARWLLGCGIGATIAANVLDGIGNGFLGAIVAAWPALALVGSYELLMLLVRGHAAVPAVPAVHLNGSGVLPAEAQPFAEELARGEVPGIRRIRSALHVGQPKAQEIQARLSALTHTQ